MELRRALLLFAIVLGLAAIATSVSREPASDDGQPATTSPGPVTAGPGKAPRGKTVSFTEDGPERTERVPAGTPLTVTVEVREPGQAEIPTLGLNSAAEPRAPARFDIFAADEAEHRITFRPVASGEPRTVGTIEIGPAETGR